MKKKLGIAFGITAVSILAVVGIFAGIAAQSDGSGDGKRSFADRVASILGLDSSVVQDAFTQAKDEMRDERKDEYLAKLVEHGKLTQEEADAIVAWQDSKPDVELNYGETAKAGKRGWSGKMAGKGLGSVMLTTEKLDYLVSEGVLSQADADALSAWHDARPDALAKLMSKRGDWDKRGKGWHGKKDRRGFGWGDKDEKVDA